MASLGEFCYNARSRRFLPTFALRTQRGRSSIGPSLITDYPKASLVTLLVGLDVRKSFNGSETWSSVGVVFDELDDQVGYVDSADALDAFQAG